MRGEGPQRARPHAHLKHHTQGYGRTDVDARSSEQRQLKTEMLGRARLALERACAPARSKLMSKTRQLHDLQARFHMRLEDLGRDVPNIERDVAFLERRGKMADAEKEREKVTAIREEQAALKEQVTQQVGELHRRIARHRADTDKYSEKHHAISATLDVHMSPSRTRDPALLESEVDGRLAQARAFSQIIGRQPSLSAVRANTLRRSASIWDPDPESPTEKMWRSTECLAGSTLQATSARNAFMAVLHFENCEHLDSMLSGRGVSTVAQLASLSIEHVRALPCGNADKTLVLNASREARLRLPAASGQSLTARAPWSYQALFSHRKDRAAHLEKDKRSEYKKLRHAVTDRDLAKVLEILGAMGREAALRAVNDISADNSGDGWSILQRVCLTPLTQESLSNAALLKTKRYAVFPLKDPKFSPMVQEFSPAALHAVKKFVRKEAVRRKVQDDAKESEEREEEEEEEDESEHGEEADKDEADLDDDDEQESTNSGMVRPMTSISDTSDEDDPPPWLKEEAPKPNKLLLHSIRKDYQNFPRTLPAELGESNIQGSAELDLQQRDTAIIKVLLEAKADVHHKNTYGRTALHYAAMEGNLSACHELLQAGSLPHEFDKLGFTPIQHSVLMKRADWNLCHDLLIRVRPLRTTICSIACTWE